MCQLQAKIGRFIYDDRVALFAFPFVPKIKEDVDVPVADP